VVIFIGDRPSPRMKKNAEPFEGAACEKRLKEWIRFLIESSLYYKVINQCDWTYHDFHVLLLQQHKIVALGNNASKALGDIPHFKLPHPSGLNRQINNKAFVKKQLKLCKKWINKNE
jgi:uracil-DNA glycosylase